MTSRALRAGIAAAVTILAALAGCVDEDPLITGHRSADGGTSGGTDAGNDAAPPIVINTVVPREDYPDGGDVDDPKCRHCNETLDTNKARGTLCAKNDSNGKSSVQTLNALVDCVCYDKCPAFCGNYCAGGKTDDDCQLCIASNCSPQLTACVLDKKN